jgi:hypothetical protein
MCCVFSLPLAAMLPKNRFDFFVENFWLAKKNQQKNQTSQMKFSPLEAAKKCKVLTTNVLQL